MTTPSPLASFHKVTQPRATKPAPPPTHQFIVDVIAASKNSKKDLIMLLIQLHGTKLHNLEQTRLRLPKMYANVDEDNVDEFSKVNLKMAALAGLNAADPRMINEAGVMFNKGEDVAQNFRVAELLFEVAANAGNAKASSNLGILYRDEAMKEKQATEKEDTKQMLAELTTDMSAVAQLLEGNRRRMIAQESYDAMRYGESGAHRSSLAQLQQRYDAMRTMHEQLATMLG